MSGLRRCRWCQHPLTRPGTPASGRLRTAHCGNPACSWCQRCVDTRHAAIEAGRLDLLQPVPPETPCEQTREIPPVRDGEPPIDPTDQMT